MCNPRQDNGGDGHVLMCKEPAKNYSSIEDTYDDSLGFCSTTAIGISEADSISVPNLSTIMNVGYDEGEYASMCKDQKRCSVEDTYDDSLKVCSDTVVDDSTVMLNSKSGNGINGAPIHNDDALMCKDRNYSSVEDVYDDTLGLCPDTAINVSEPNSTKKHGTLMCEDRNYSSVEDTYDYSLGFCPDTAVNLPQADFQYCNSVGFLENEDDIKFGEGLTVRQVFDVAFVEKYKSENKRTESNDEDQYEKSSLNDEILELQILEYKKRTGVDINSVRVFKDASANSLCEKQGRPALVCKKGILLAKGQEENIDLLEEALNKLGEYNNNLVLKGQGTWYLYYKTIPEILPIFKLVADSKKKLLDNFNDGDFFYKWGTSIWQLGTNTLGKADDLAEKYYGKVDSNGKKIEDGIIDAAIKDSEKRYVPFGEGPEGQKKFKEIFEVNYDASAVKAAADEAKKLIYLVAPIEKFREYGTPIFHLWREDERLQGEMEQYNVYLTEMLDSMGVLAEAAEVKKYTQIANKIKSNNDPKKYDEWRDYYVEEIYDELKGAKKIIENNAKSKLINAYGKYGKFYYDVINEIRNSKIVAFGLETLVSTAIGGGTGLVGKKMASVVGKKAVQQGAEKVVANGVKKGAKEVVEESVENSVKTAAKQGAEKTIKREAEDALKDAAMEEFNIYKFLLKESIDNTLFSCVANLDHFQRFGGRNVSGADFALSVFSGVLSALGINRGSYGLKKAGKWLWERDLFKKIRTMEFHRKNHDGVSHDLKQQNVVNGGENQGLIVNESAQDGINRGIINAEEGKVTNLEGQFQKSRKGLVEETGGKLSLYQNAQIELGRDIKNAENMIQVADLKIDNRIMDFIANSRKIGIANSRELGIFRKNKEIYEGEMHKVEQQVKTLKNDLVENESVQEGIKREIKKTGDKLSLYQNAQIELGRDIKNAENMIQVADFKIDNRIRDFIANGGGKQRLNAVKSEIEGLVREKEEIEKMLEILRKNKEIYADEMRKMEKQTENLRKKLVAKEAVQEDINSELKKAEDDLSLYKTVLKKFRRNIKNAEDNPRKQRLNAVKSEIDGLVSEKEEIEKVLEILRKNKEIYADEMGKVEQQFDNLRKNLVENKSVQESIKNETKKIEKSSSLRQAKQTEFGKENVDKMIPVPDCEEQQVIKINEHIANGSVPVKKTNFLLKKLQDGINKAPTWAQLLIIIPEVPIKGVVYFFKALFVIGGVFVTLIPAIFNEKYRKVLKNNWKILKSSLHEVIKSLPTELPTVILSHKIMDWCNSLYTFILKEIRNK